MPSVDAVQKQQGASEEIPHVGPVTYLPTGKRDTVTVAKQPMVSPTADIMDADVEHPMQHGLGHSLAGWVPSPPGQGGLTQWTGGQRANGRTRGMVQTQGVSLRRDTM